MNTKFQIEAASVSALMATYEGYCAVAAEIERFRKANGMRTGLNLTKCETQAEAIHWAGR